MTKQEKMAQAPALYLQALNDKNLDAIVALYAEDAEVEDPVGTAPHKGIAAVRAFYEGVMGSDLQAELTGPVRIAADEVAFPFTVKTVAGGITMHIIDVFKFNEEGLVCSMRAFWGESNAVPL
jgi:steroid Delta-isomerase